MNYTSFVHLLGGFVILSTCQKIESGPKIEVFKEAQKIFVKNPSINII